MRLERARAQCGALFDESALTLGIRKPDNLGMRILFCQPERQRTPAATQIENAHAVSEAGTLGVKREHRFFGLSQRLATAAIQAARVLQSRAQMAVKEFCRHFVVLGIRRGGRHRNRAGAQLGDEAVETL